MATFGLDHGLDPRSEGRAGALDELVRHCGPFPLDGDLELVDIAVWDGAGPPFNDAPKSKVERI